MRTLLAALALPLLCVMLHAQDSTTTTFKHNRIIIDVGVQMPNGNDATTLGARNAVGFGLTFWQLFDQRFITMVSFGSSTMQLGTAVPTDSGIQDLSNYSVQIVPLMGGIGYLFSGMPVIPYVCAEAGVSFLTLNAGSNRPVADFNNEAYFSYGGRVGLGYPVSDNIALQVNARYIKVATVSFGTFGVNGGIAWSF